MGVKLDRARQVDVEDLVFAREGPGVDPLLQVRAELAVLGQNLGAGFRVEPDRARQGKQPQGRFKVDRGQIHRFENGCCARFVCGGHLFRGRLTLGLSHGDLAGGGVDSFDRCGDDGRNIGLGRSRRELSDVRSEPAVLRNDLLTVLRVEPDDAVGDDRGVDELAGFGRGQFVGSEFRRNVYAAGRGIRCGIGVDDLEVGTVLADAQRDVVADGDRVDHARVDLTEVVDDLSQAAMLVAAEIEAVEPVETVGFAAGDAVEVVLHLGGEVVFDQVAKELFEQAHDREGDPVGNERLAARRDIAALGDGRDDRRECRGAADAELFEFFDQAGLGVASSRGRLVALGFEAL